MTTLTKQSLAETHPHLIDEWHPTKNGDLTPNDVTFGSTIRIWWKCYKGTWPNGDFADDHEWETTVRLRTRTSCKNGCPCCSKKKTVPSNSLAATHPHLIDEWHPTKNGDLTPWNVVAGSDKKVWWKCHKGIWPNGDFADDHEWKATIKHRALGNTDCPCCPCLAGGAKKVVPSNCLTTTHPELAADWHPTRNGNLTPEQVTAGSGKKYSWLGKKCGHEWEATCTGRTGKRKHGCPICNESKGEKVIAKYLEEKSIKFQREYRFKTSTIARARFDFATKLGLIEFHGIQHYLPICFSSKEKHAKIRSLISTIERDQKKERWCKQHKIPLLIIPYWDFDRIEEILDSFFAGEEPFISPTPEEVKKYESMRQKIIERLKNKFRSANSCVALRKETNVAELT